MFRSGGSNQPDRLEHGFTICKRPVSDGQSLVLRLRIRGGLQPVASDDGRGITFRDESGAAQVNYAALKVSDANGRQLNGRLQTRGKLIEFTVDDHAAQYPITVDPFVSEAFVKASNTDANDEFGSAVASSGDTVVIGAPGEASDATGVNGDQNDNSVPGAGAAYVFVRVTGEWQQQAYLKASNTRVNAPYGFGGAVAISGDTIVIGAPGEASNATGVNGNQNDNSASGAGAAYVFVRNRGEWQQQAYLKASNTRAVGLYGAGFGASVAVSGDTIVIGARGEASNATGINGNQNDTSAPGPGAAYVFERISNHWRQAAYLKGPVQGAYIGYSVAISGNTIVTGSSVFTRVAGFWAQQALLDTSGVVAIAGDTIAVGNPGGGFGPDFGSSTDKPVPFDGVPNAAGIIHTYQRTQGVWNSLAQIEPTWGSISGAGAALAISGDTLITGSAYDNYLNGEAIVYGRDAAGWNDGTYLSDFRGNCYGECHFGGAVGISGSTVVASDPFESSAATGVNNPQENYDALSSGAAYMYFSGDDAAFLRLSNTDWTFAAHPSGQSSGPGKIFVTNSGTVPLEIGNPRIIGGEDSFQLTTNCPPSLSPSKFCSLDFQFTPSRTGEIKAVIELNDNTPDSPHQIPIKGVGDGPALDFSNYTWNFNSQTVGHRSTPGKVYLTNSGNTPLHFSSVTVAGQNPADFVVMGQTCGTTVAPYKTCSVEFEFVPTAPGVRSATLDFGDDALPSLQSLPLWGTGLVR